MCDTALSLASDHLVPLARDHLLPILKEVADMIRGVPKEIADMKDELENIEDFINKADRMADAEEDNNTSKGIKARIKQLIEASFHIEDVIDEYILCEEQAPGCTAGVKTMILRLQIAYKIQNIKTRISEINDTSGKNHIFQIQSSLEKGSTSSSTTNINASLLKNLRKAPFYMDEADVVGFEVPRDTLIDWLVGGRAERTIVSVVGMGGQGKTTLAKKVFDNHKVIEHFDCHVWITVSQSYNIEVLLMDMLQKLYKQQRLDLPQRIREMDRDSLVDEMRNYLQEKRYVIVFDDVWNIHIWNEFEFAMIDNKKGSKILITTRNMNVANACRKSSFVEVYKLKGLTENQSFELFNKKAFHDLNGCCPKNLVDISSKIVEKCNGLPLAIVVTGGLLSCKDRNTFEWYKFCENLNSELDEDSKITKILSLSYHDLPYNLKSCLMYFGLYPDDYVVNPKILIRQWVAEGFVKEDRGKTLEEVGKGYLTELIYRNLVQVVSITVDGRAKHCRVHDLVHAMILSKIEELSYGKIISEDDQPCLRGMVRRLSITTESNNLIECIDHSHVRSYLFVKPKKLHEHFAKTIPTEYRRLKVIDLGDARIDDDPKLGLGSLSQLKYFRLNVGEVREFPKSIGNLENLETLHLTGFNDRLIMPKEICKLRKLRHLQGYRMSLIELKDGIGGMTSLQTLRNVYLDEGDNEDSVKELIGELGKLKQLRELTIISAKSEYMSVISSSINGMQQMEKLYIQSNGYGTNMSTIRIYLNSPPPMLRSLQLFGKLNKVFEWIPKLENLVKLKLHCSGLEDGEMKLLINNSIPNLLTLHLMDNAYEGESLHFQDGCLKNLKEIVIYRLKNVKFIVIDEGALRSLKILDVGLMHGLEAVPTGIQHLKKLEVLRFRLIWNKKILDALNLKGGKVHWSFKHVPVVDIHY